MAVENKITDLSFEALLGRNLRILQARRQTGKVVGGSVSRGLVEIAAPEQLAIVGDLHGDLQTLEIILKELDSADYLANQNNKLVFLGDYVDRGKNSMHVLSRLFDLQADFPESVILMRGNHEAPIRFPFRQHDLPANMRAEFFRGREIYDRVNCVFELLPVVTLVTDKLLMVHGGLPRSEIAENPRKIISLATEDEKVLEELLWNDPRQLGVEHPWEKSRRSYGYHFGRSVTQAWISALGVKAVVRGHEPSPGFSMTHEGAIMTLFSCRESYPGYKAAYVSISGDELESLESAEDLVPSTHVL